MAAVLIDNTDSVDENLWDDIFRERNKLEEMWIDRLRTEWGDTAEQKLGILKQPNQVNILDLSLRVLSGRGEVSREDVESFIQRVRGPNYSISEMFTEFVCLEDVISEYLHARRKIKYWDLSIIVNQNFRNSFCKLFNTVLLETSEFYENVIEQSNTGFCQTDEHCCIVYANQETKTIIGNEKIIGKPLASFFDGYERDLVHQALSGDEKAPVLEALSIRTSNGESVPVGVNLARVFIDGKPAGGYAHITNISRPITLQNQVFDRLLLGIIRLNHERKITFMNRNLKEMLGITGDDWKSRPIDWLIPDVENKKIIDSQLDERFVQGKSDEYTTSFRRMDGRKIPVPVQITAAPEKDEKGRVIRTIGFVRSMVRERMNQHIIKQRDPQTLMQEVMEDIQSAIPYDRAYVALYNSDMSHVRTFFQNSHERLPETYRRWWKMTPGMIEWALKKEIFSVSDVNEFYKQEEFRHLKTDPAIQEIIQNFRSFIYYPVYREAAVVACAMFYSKSNNGYSKKDHIILKSLPLDSAILMAIHYEEKNDLLFQLNLSKKISLSGDDEKQMARVLVDEIAHHYDWQIVALFNTRKSQRHFHLLNQHAPEEFRIPEDFTLSIDKNVLGDAYRTKQSICVDDLQKKKYKDIYTEIVPKSRSVLCIPIESGELFWLLYIADPRENAFSKEEERTLLHVVNEVRLLLERSWLKTFLDKSLLCSSDAVWVTDNDGKITRFNPAAVNLLRFREEDLLNRPLKDILLDPGWADRLIETDKVPNVKISLRTRDEKIVRVLLSKFRLQEYFKTDVYIAKDLSEQERIEELEYLGKMYYEIATQTQTPVNLIFGWLERIVKKTHDQNIKEIVDRSIRQLRKVELTFNRLSLYDKRRIFEPSFPYNEVLSNMKEIWHIVKEDFPENELKYFEPQIEDEDKYFLCDLFQLPFCFETILSYLLRFLPEDEKIFMNTSTNERMLNIKIHANMPGLKFESQDIAQRGQIAKSLVEMALGEEILSKFLKNHQGNYFKSKWSGDQIEFAFEIPLWRNI